MTELKLKICGMKHPQNITEVATLQPDYMGFIFYEKTLRFFDGEIPKIPSEIIKTGVFVDASVDFVAEKIQKHELKAVQLHGNESPEFCRNLRENLSEKNIKIIKVFSVKEAFNFKKSEAYEGIVDFFLFDTKGKTKGGTGKTFNWEVLKDYPSSTPFFLSGGIGLEEVDAIKNVQQYFEKQNRKNIFYAIDVNSRFETNPGLKDQALLKKFKNKVEGKN